MRTKSYRFIVIVIFSLWAVAGLLGVATPVDSAPEFAPVAQRPTVIPGDGGGGNGGADGTGGLGVGRADTGGATDVTCASVVGQIINWGFGGQGGVTAELKNGSWQISTISAADGNYGFGGLGVGVAVLHVILTPGQAEQFQPHLQDTGIYLNCSYPTVANIALYDGPRIRPPVTIKMSALHEVITSGGGTEITLKVNNSLPNDITNVVVTDLMPVGLIALDVSSSIEAKNIDIINGPDRQLVAVNLDRLAAGAEAAIRITVIGAVDVPGSTQVTNTATLFYRESVADQTSLDLTIRGSGALVAPVITTPIVPATPALPAVEAAPTATPELEPTSVTTTTMPALTPTVESEGSEEFVPPDGLPTTGDDAPGADNFVPPSFLPTTGEDVLQIPATLPNTGLGFILPIGGVGLAMLAFAVHHLRSSYRNRE
ncbi:MAG: DUF11 domain-containing protein [Anaerolineae bacterium]|nr:DUF11 domain-containing protein [Anaerolineae bacterium]